MPNHIKIDVDGIEHLILSGAFQTLRNVKSVLVELDQSFSTQTAEATRYLDEAGFSLTNANDISDKRQSNQIWTRTKWYK